MANVFQRDVSQVVLTSVALLTAILVIGQLIFFWNVPTPKTGALTQPLKISPDADSVIHFGENTTVKLSQQRYVFGPGKQAAQSSPLSPDSPLVLGLGSSLLNSSTWQLNTEIGVGKMFYQDDLSLGDTVTQFSSQLSQQVNTKLALQADYRLMEGATLHTQDWILGLQYQINERAQWKFRHTESQGNSAADPSQRETSMAYHLRF